MNNVRQDKQFDTVALQVFRNIFSSLADEMGITLQRASFSPNIKLRLDFSCAVFDSDGLLLAQAAHIPVHLGAMSMALTEILSSLRLDEGDVAIVNDPIRGGTHLPDISLASAAYSGGTLLGYVMSRAHHSDVGGMTPGSMPLAQNVFAEGIIIPPVKLVVDGRLDEEVLGLILRNVRTPDERRGDLLAQLAAQRFGNERLLEIAERYGPGEIRKQGSELMRYAEVATQSLIDQMPRGDFLGEDYLDDDGFTDDSLPIRVSVHIDPEAGGMVLDFSGTATQRQGPVNATRAVTQAAVLYVVRTLMRDDIPVNAGMLRRVDIKTEPGTIVDATGSAAVSAGNVETSQRIVDVLYKAFSTVMPQRVPAASQGTMNNFAFGGIDTNGKAFAYYETLGGGMGARPGVDGASGFHDHMSNTMNTPVEALESQLPVRIHRYGLRNGSGGWGRWKGGDGVDRQIEFLGPATVSVISDRRRLRPYGLHGGTDGAAGYNSFIRNGEVADIGSKVVMDIVRGDVLNITTPGGGGSDSIPGRSGDSSASECLSTTETLNT